MFDLHKIENNLLLTKEDIANIIHNEVIREANSKLSWNKKSTINAGDLTGCVKALYFKLKGVTPSNPPTYQYSPIVLNIGTTIHSIIERLVSPGETEIPIRCDYMGFKLNMRADAIYNMRVLHEYKTVDSVTDETLCKKEHLIQSSIYAYLLNTKMNRDLSHIQIIYIARGKVNIKVFNIKIDNDLMTKVKTRLDDQLGYLKNCLDTNSIPSFESKYCECNPFCEYREFCKSLSS